jgi:hypothetical protein
LITEREWERVGLIKLLRIKNPILFSIWQRSIREHLRKDLDKKNDKIVIEK